MGHSHTRDKLCESGKKLYGDALRFGRISRGDMAEAPCLIDLALLRPDPDDSEWFLPVPPSLALNQLVHPLEREIQERRQQALSLTDTFEPFMRLAAREPAAMNSINVLEGLNIINSALDRAAAECTEELLTVQPGSGRRPETLEHALRRMDPLLNRGVQMRTLYQHTARHHPSTLAYVERVVPYGAEVRTLEEIIERLIILDRKVAFVPARSDRQVALELRHEGLVNYLVGVFEQFWLYGVPWEKQISYAPELDGITNVQRSIAKLLVDGLVDEAIARRLGMNVRTCRTHIAKLATALGSGSRAQLGFYIAQSGILDEKD